MRATAEGVGIAVRRSNGVWMVRPDGAALDALIAATGPVALWADGTVFASGEDVVIEARGRNPLRFPLRDAVRIAPLGDGWMQVSAAGGEYALRIDAGKEGLYVLPAESGARRPARLHGGSAGGLR
jgi:hypothetical protein